MPQAAPRLVVQNLVRNFDGTTVVNDLSLTISAGQVTCLLGPSGCGKSTSLRMIAGVDRPDSGRIIVDDAIMCDDQTFCPPEERGVGLMFQDFALFPHLSILDNIGFGLKGDQTAKHARSSELLEQVGLLKHAKSFPHQLSGGEQQRVALARALAPRPKVMLMDEPFSGLDNRLRDGIRDDTLTLLKEAGTAVLLVTHDPEEAMKMADEIALMRRGKIVQKGSPYNIYNEPQDIETVSFFSDVNVVSGTSNGALVDTVFGPILTPGLEPGTIADIVFRPQHVKVEFDRAGKGPCETKVNGVAARAHVQRARFLGSHSQIVFRLEGTGQDILVSLPSVFLPEQGRAFWLTVPRQKCLVFPKNTS